MKKVSMMLSMLSLSLGLTNAFANAPTPVCVTLANSTWTGKVYLENDKIIPIKLSIENVTKYDDYRYNITGFINGKPFLSTSYCSIKKPDNSLNNLEIRASDIDLHAIYANDRHNPNPISVLGNAWDDDSRSSQQIMGGYISRD